MSFADLQANLNLNTANFAAGLRRASKETHNFAKTLNTKMSSGTKGLKDLTDEANKSKFAFKDVARVIQGIILSRVFYAGLQAVQGATAAVIEFSKSLEYAQIAYSELFGSTELATEFINVLQDFAAVTPFTFEQAENSARRLLAYGMEYKNVMYVMQGVMAASSMSADPTTVERVSRALGQIYTKGRLMNEELRQLAEAGIPVYEVLEEKLGLTKDQIANIGRERIGADVAINALVDGMNERFGDVLNASTMTLKGIMSNIQDNLMMLASEIIKPIYGTFKNYFAEFGTFLISLRDALNKFGTGGLFERLVPKELQGALRQLIANLTTFGRILSMLFASLWRVGQAVFRGILPALNAFFALINPILMVIGAFVQWLTRCKVAMEVLAAAVGFAAVAFGIYYTRLALMWVMKKVILLIDGVSIAFNVLSMTVMKSPLFFALGALIALLVAVAATATQAGAAIRNVFGQFTKIMGIDPKKLLLPSQKDRAADLSKFNKALEGTSSGMDDLADSAGKAAKAGKGLLSFDEVFSLKQTDENDKGGIGEDYLDKLGLGGGLIPEVPDLSEFASAFEFELTDELKKRLTGAAVGGVAGGIIGLILTGGNPVGGQVGAVVGAIAGTFWPEIEAWWMDWTTKLGEKIGIWYYDTSTAFTTWCDGVKEGFDTWATETGDKIGTWYYNTKTSITTWVDETKASIAGWWTDTNQGIANWVTESADKFVNWALDTEDSFNNWTTNTGTKLGEWYYNTKTGIGTWVDETKTKFLGWCTDVQMAFQTAIPKLIQFFEDLKTNVKTKVEEFKTNVTTKFNEIKNNIMTPITEAYNTVKGKFDEMKSNISTAVSTVLTTLIGWKDDMKEKVFGKIGSYIDEAVGKFTKLYKWAVDAAAAIGIKLPPAPYGGTAVGHKYGGVFDKEHIAPFAEGNKKEAIIPLEVESAMQPFVDAVANGLVASLAPVFAGGNTQLPPMYVGTLIADENGLRELNRKMRVINLQEQRRVGE